MISETSLTLPNSSFISVAPFSQMSPFVETKETKKKLDNAIVEKFSYKIKYDQLEDEYKQVKQKVKKLEAENIHLSRLLDSNSQLIFDKSSMNDTFNDSFEISKLKSIIKDVKTENSSLKTQVNILMTKREVTKHDKEPQVFIPQQNNTNMTSIMFDPGDKDDTQDNLDISNDVENISRENIQLKTMNENLEEENERLKEENEQLLREANSHDELFEKYNKANELIGILQDKLEQNSSNFLAEKRISELTEKYEKEFDTKEKLEMQIAKMDDEKEEQSKKSKEDKEKLLKIIKENEEIIKKQSTDIESYKEQIKTMKEKMKETETLLKEANETNMSLSRNISLLQTPKKQTEGEEYMTKYKKAKEELSKRRSIIEKLTSEKRTLISQLSQQEKNMKDYEKRINDLKETLIKQENNNKLSNDKIKVLEKESKQQKNASYEQLRREISSLMDQNVRLTKLLRETSSRVVYNKTFKETCDVDEAKDKIKSCFNYNKSKSGTPRKVMFSETEN